MGQRAPKLVVFVRKTTLTLHEALNRVIQWVKVKRGNKLRTEQSVQFPRTLWVCFVSQSDHSTLGFELKEPKAVFIV